MKMRRPEVFMESLKKAFGERFGLKEFRPDQLHAMKTIMLQQDCFVLMPTGGGKSLCYQLPAIISAGVTIVICPLKSLIQDQIRKLNALSIPADTLSVEVSIRSENEIYDDLKTGKPTIKLLYLTPEKLTQSDRLQGALTQLYKRKRLERFVIDEAHCVSEWGHDFRPAYGRLGELKAKFPDLPIMALTATATQRVRADILTQLKMRTEAVCIEQSVDRMNLQFEVRRKTKGSLNEMADIIYGQFLDKSGIIYCLSKEDCEQVADHLNRRHSIGARAYHAGLADRVRRETQDEWLSGRCKLICATVAFGMGIDKPDVRYVFHYSLPKSIEALYQEAGRKRILVDLKK